MGNANSQMLENLVQGSNCESPFLIMSAAHHMLTIAYSRQRRIGETAKEVHEAGQGVSHTLLFLTIDHSRYS